MRQALRRFWQDEAGSATADWAFIATILVLGAITGAALRQVEVERFCEASRNEATVSSSAPAP
jgi:Flp pilus assembly pilin Flp